MRLLLALCLLGIVMAACGTTTPPNVFHACGTVHVAAGRVPFEDVTAASLAETCFAHDFTSCQPATLTFTDLGVDTSTTHTFTESLFNGQCTVKDQVQVSTANGGGTTFPTQTYTCTGVQQQADGLHMTDCGQEGTVLVPAPTGE